MEIPPSRAGLRSVLPLAALLVSALSLSPALAAQAAPPAVVEARWPTSWTPPEPELLALLQVGRPPVLDEAGEVIPYEEILARIDPSGAGEGLLAGAFGLGVGILIGSVLSPDCNTRKGDYFVYCSPREEALKTALPAGLGAALAAIGFWVGAESGRTTFVEALAQIRAERSARSGR